MLLSVLNKKCGLICAFKNLISASFFSCSIKFLEIRYETALVSNVEPKTQFLNAELNSENIKKISSVFNENLTDSASFDRLKMNSNLVELNDTIISYGYDDNFNEVEKISYQKIVQPNYEISIQSSNPDKIWAYFQNKKWINAQNKFTVIPFQPNLISKEKKHVSIKSTPQSVKLSDTKNENYIYV